MDMKFSFADVCAAGGFTVTDLGHRNQNWIEQYLEPYIGNNIRKQACWAVPIINTAAVHEPKWA